nr:retrovirus-related Pol polyprotein from transposon TNT 1-94 [Tanacetum cinerariifolium]
MVVDPTNPTVPILEPLSKMTEGNKKQYIADVRVMNYFLQAIPNDIYNSVDAWIVIMLVRYWWQSIQSFSISCNQNGANMLPCIKGKETAKNHDPLALIAHSNASSSHSHANFSCSSQPYYVRHPPSVIDYDDEYQGELQGDSQEDKLITAMMMVNLTYKPRMQVMVEMLTIMQGEIELNGLIDEMQCYKCNEKGHYARECQKLKFCDSKYFREQMLLAMKDEAGSNLNNEENDFMLDTSYGEELEELTVAVMLMAQIQPADKNVKTIPSYDAMAQHQKEINEMSEDVTQNTYAYAEVRAQNQDLFMIISELKSKLKTIDNGKHVNDKFDISETLGQLLYVTPFNKNLAIKTKNVSNIKATSDRKSCVKIALFTSPVPTKSKSLGATYVVAKSRFSVAKTPTTTNKVGEFCDGDLEVAFRSNTCYVQNLEGDDLLMGSRYSNLYSIFISEIAASSPVCLMSKATSTKSWLWPRRLSHLNFDTINQLTFHDLVDGLPEFKKASLSPKLVPSTESKLELLHMDLCGPMRVASINGKKYILLIVDDYSRFTWVFLRAKDEALDMIIDFVNQVQRNLKASILTIQTDNGTEFKNEKLRSFYAKLGIVHKTLIARTPQQNGVVERRNRTLIEAARIMLILSKAPEFM